MIFLRRIAATPTRTFRGDADAEIPRRRVAPPRPPASQEEEEEEVVVVEETVEEVVVEEKEEENYDDVSVSSDESVADEKDEKPPADFATWLSDPMWAAWRNMAAGKPAPPSLFGLADDEDEKAGKFKPLNNSFGRKRPMTGFGFKRSGDYSPAKPPASSSKYQIDDHGLRSPNRTGPRKLERRNMQRPNRPRPATTRY